MVAKKAFGLSKRFGVLRRRCCWVFAGFCGPWPYQRSFADSPEKERDYHTTIWLRHGTINLFAHGLFTPSNSLAYLNGILPRHQLSCLGGTIHG